MRGLSDLAALRRFSGAPKEFWPRLVACAADLAGTDALVLLLGQPGRTPRWGRIGEAPPGSGAALMAAVEAAAERCLSRGGICEPIAGGHLLAVRLELSRSADELVLGGRVPGQNESVAREALLRLQLIADTPELYQTHLASEQARHDVEKFATVLDLLAPVHLEKRFLAAALALGNGVATRFRCDRVSLGSLQAGYVRLRAISRTEKFDRKMVAAQGLEAAMEECLDQDEEILWPAPDGASVVTRDHEKFAQEQSAGYLCSLPLRVEDKPVAVLTCERQAGAFSVVEVQQLRLCCDQVARRLDDLQRHDRWFGARWIAAAREGFGKVLGPEHTWRKVLALAAAAALAALFLVKVTYRVEGRFILRSDEVAYITAPFDGYLQDVPVRPGDHVPQGSTFLTLDPSELLLEESAALADSARYQRETEKARAAQSLAEMRISEALVQQAAARLALVRHRLESAVVKAAFDGVIVEGDLRERIGAPVKQGDALCKVARLDALYAEAEVNERDVQEILGRQRGEIAFVTQPRLRYPVAVTQLEPAAVPKPEGNVFLVRLHFERGLEPWWRPGMTGLCKLEVEPRTLWWILTHRTVDFLRMKLWW